MGVSLLPFLGLSVLLIVIPGPDTAVVMKNTLLGGRRSGVLSSIGVSIGLAVWTVAAAFGIAALLRASSIGFLALKLAGALYLIWLGIQALRAHSDPVQNGRPPARGGRALRQGLVSNLGNPKIAVFFSSFLPQFVHGSGTSFASLLLLGGIFCAMTLLWLVLYSLAVDRISAVVRRPSIRRAIDRVTGVVLIGFGVRLALKRR